MDFRGLFESAPGPCLVLDPDFTIVGASDAYLAETKTRRWSPLNSPVLDGHRRLAYIIHRVEDVTEFVRLQQRNELMESEIIRRGQDLQESNEQLRTANSAKNEFLSRMSHELRSPLGAMMGFRAG